MTDPAELIVSRLSPEQGFGDVAEWQALVDKWCPDRIFLTPAWASSWWDAWGRRQPNYELCVLQARDPQGQLIGVAPLYISNDPIRAGMHCRRLQFIGTNFRKSGVTRTEYVDFPARPGKQQQVLAAILGFIADELSFDEFVLTDLRRDTPTRTYLSEFARSRAWLERPSNLDQGTRIELEGDYANYLSRLGRNTRLRLHNRRKVLESLGQVEFHRYGTDQLDSGFEEMDRLFRRRWSQPVCNSAQLDFQRLLVERLPDNAEVQLTGISVDGQVVSVQYNIRMAGTEYNFLSGFQDDLHSKLSVGMLHFGYSIEQAYVDGLRHYDLLLGSGRTTHYKKNFAGQTIEAETVQLIQHPMLKAAYVVYDKLMALTRRRHARS